MKLYKDSGTNPFASCLPILLQMPIFFALFRLIDKAADGDGPRLPDRGPQAEQFGEAELFGELPIAGIVHRRRRAASRSRSSPRCLVLAMTATTFLTQRQLMAQEHAGGRADRPLRPAAEDAALRAAGGLRRRRHRVPDRRAPLLDHLEPVDDGPAVLRDPQQPGARDRGGAAQGGAGPKKAAKQGPGPAATARSRRRRRPADDGDGARSRAAARSDRRPPQRQQPKRQSKSQRQAQAAAARRDRVPPANQRAQNEKRNGNKQ